MRIGTKTLLFGNHQFLIHPFMVGLAWVKLYHKFPNPKEAVCIFIHDWGYWGCPNIDGNEGEQHPRWAAIWAGKHLDIGMTFTGIVDFRYANLCAYHSGTFAKSLNAEVSQLYMPDKVGIAITPVWLLTLCGKLTGETKEYRSNPKYAIAQRDKLTDYGLYKAIRDYYHDKVIPEFQRRG